MRFFEATSVFLGIAAIARAQPLPTLIAEPSAQNSMSGTGKYYFIVSEIRQTKSWCIDLAFGDKDFSELRLRPCDFVGSPAEQLWSMDDDGKIHSAVNPGKVLVVNHGQVIFNGVHLRIADENDKNFRLNSFDYDEKMGYLKVKGNNAYCVTNKGPNPNPGDVIFMKPCENQGRFMWKFVSGPDMPPSGNCLATGGTVGKSLCCEGTDNFPNTCLVGACGCSPMFSSEIMVCNCPAGKCFDGTNCVEEDPEEPELVYSFFDNYYNGGCIELQNGSAKNFNKLVLGSSCSGGKAKWRIDNDGLIHSAANDDKCMQVGQGGPIGDGTKMRLNACDSTNMFQKFDFDGLGPIMPKSPMDLCVVKRGTSANYDVDPIIVKKCELVRGRETWKSDTACPNERK